MILPFMTAPTHAVACLMAVASLLWGIVPEAGAQDNEAKPRLVEPHGDFRIRLEQDWDSLQGDGTQRDDRLRLWVRLRVGLDLNFDDQWSARV